MKTFISTLVLGGLLSATAALAADSFEGKVTLAMSSPKGKSTVINYEMKGHLMRIDMENAPVTTVMDINKREMTMFMHEQKMYMTHAMPQVDPNKMQGKASEAEIEDTGRTEEILGYKCNEFIVRDGKTVTNLWLAHGLGTFMGLNQGNGGGNPFMRRGARSANAAKWEEVLKDKGGFPLRVITHDASGKESFKMEAKKIEPGSVPDADFEPPPGYQKFQMPKIPGFGG